MSQNFTFTHFPELHSSRLTLRQAMKEDVKDLFALYSDETVVQFLLLHPFVSLKDVEEEMNWYQTIFADQSGLRWMIEDQHAKKVIGTCGFLNYEKTHNRIEIGYDLAPAFWRQGIMAEALKMIIDFGFSIMQVNKIEAKVDKRNHASIRLLEKMEFQQEGLLREHEFEKGVYINLLVFSQLSNDQPSFS